MKIYIVTLLVDLINITHATDDAFTPVTYKQCRNKVASDAGEAKNKVSKEK